MLCDVAMFNNKYCRVILHHKLFGAQIFDIDKIQIINDNIKIGIIIKYNNIYIYKNDIIKYNITENGFSVESNRLKIQIILK